MKTRLLLIILLVLIYVCDRQLVAPIRNNPFDSANELTSDTPFNLQTQNQSNHILISWEYLYEKPILDGYLLYRVDSSGLDTLYVGSETIFEDVDVEWDSTYSYYVTAMINEKETSPPEIDDLKAVQRKIYVGMEEDYESIQDALEALEDGVTVYVKDGTYEENINFKGKKITVKCNGQPGDCILDGGGSGTVVTFDENEDENSILDGFTITGGSSTDEFDGGGMTIKSDPVIQNCILVNNTAERGGAVFIRSGAQPQFSGCTFQENTATGEGGGAIYCYSSAKPTIENCSFIDNESEGSGGAIVSISANPVMTNSIFSMNKANGNDITSDLSLNGYGGAIYIESSNGMTINKCTFEGNIAVNGGGAAGIAFNSNAIEFRQCQFTQNTSAQGGAVFTDNSGVESMPITLQNCIFWDQVTSYGGGAIYGQNSMINMDHCTLYGNDAGSGEQSKGGGLYCSTGLRSQIWVTNSIFNNNNAFEDAEIYFSDLGTPHLIVYSNIDAIGWDDVGNIKSPPLFVNPGGGDFQLQQGSGCIGTGQFQTDMGAYGGDYGNWE